MKRFVSMIFSMALLCSVLIVGAQAADYSFATTAPQNYYASTSYEEVYGSAYNYGGPNTTDYQTAELPYGNPSTTQAGIMEKHTLLGAQMTTTSGGAYGVDGGAGIVTIPQEILPLPTVNVSPPVQNAYTSVKDMERKDGSIGTVAIPSLGIRMKVWEGETDSSMKKGLGHYVSTSGWDGNVGVCGHNRGSTYAIGSIKNLEMGATITYATVYGTRTYAVTYVGVIANNDWSRLQATADNRITLTTCLANHPESRVCVQATEV